MANNGNIYPVGTFNEAAWDEADSMLPYQVEALFSYLDVDTMTSEHSVSPEDAEETVDAMYAAARAGVARFKCVLEYAGIRTAQIDADAEQARSANEYLPTGSTLSNRPLLPMETNAMLTDSVWLIQKTIDDVKSIGASQ